MQDLEGSSDWRPFSLPFFMNEGMRPPQKLVVNVVLPGAGTVFLKPLRLVQYEGDLHTAWWGQRTGGLIGGIAGGLLGCIGSLCGILVRLGRGRRFVVGVLSALIPLGALGVVFGIAAASLSQPFPVWFPLVLPGALCFTLSLGTLPKARQRYGQMELRRMEAMDAR